MVNNRLRRRFGMNSACGSHKKAALFAGAIVLVLGLAAGCGGGGIIGGNGGTNNNNSSNGGNNNGNNNGGNTGPSVTGTVVDAGGAPVVGVSCNLVPATDVSNPIGTVVTDAQGKFSFTEFTTGQDLKVRAVDSGSQRAGESPSFRPSQDNLRIALAPIVLDQVLPPAPPF
jgi:hypothetical protein